LIQTKKELNDLKVNYSMKCTEIEQLQKEALDARAALKEKNSFNSKENTETKKLMEEIQRLRSLNKNRDEIINEMESKSKNLRETET